MSKEANKRKEEKEKEEVKQLRRKLKCGENSIPPHPRCAKDTHTLFFN
jgi:hypothetical protein